MLSAGSGYGGGGNNLYGKIGGRVMSGGKVYNDDGGDGEGSVANLIGGLGDEEGDDKLLLSTGDDASFSGDASEDDEDASTYSLVAPLLLQQRTAAEEDSVISINSKRQQQVRQRPYLSHARSLSSDMSHSAYHHRHRRATSHHPNHGRRKEWTMSKVIWMLIWMGFALPIVEAAMHEARRRLNVRYFWNARRVVGWRRGRTAPFRSGGAPNISGRVPNVHDL